MNCDGIPLRSTAGTSTEHATQNHSLEDNCVWIRIHTLMWRLSEVF
jgi:hypothetical protein